MINNFNRYLINKALNLSRFKKISYVLILDISVCFLATWLGLSIEQEKKITISWEFLVVFLTSVTILIPTLFVFNIYRVILRYINGDTLQIIIKASIIYTLFFSISIIFLGFKVPNIPRSFGIIQSVLVFSMLGFSRLIITAWLNKYFFSFSRKNIKKQVIIYGAGFLGRQLALNLVYNKEYDLVFFIDDNKNLWGGTIDGYPVRSPSYLSNSNDNKNLKEIWLAMNSLSEINRNKLMNIRNLRLHVRTLPNISSLKDNKVSLSDLRELNLYELTGRYPVKPDEDLLKKCVFKKVVLITGAGGSIGSEICRQIIIYKPKLIILIDNSEAALYHIYDELNSNFQQNIKNDTILIPLLVNVQDKHHLNHVFENWNPETVYHAAAYKHVPLVEQNIIAGIKNNLIGTLECANLAMQNNVKHFVLVSTDKAVRPTNIMGASKRLAESVLQLLSKDPNNNCTLFCIVRFGNVIGSSGSVIPLFRKQIAAGGPLTLTHKKITRYFMSIKEAAQLVVQAGAMSKGGEVFILDMGQPIRIIDLAINMIETTGFRLKDKNNLDGDIEIKVTGLRPGEKLYEELLIGKNAKPTNHKKIFKANEMSLNKKDFDMLMKSLLVFLDHNNISEIHKLLKTFVFGYLPGNNVDWISKFSRGKSK